MLRYLRLIAADFWGIRRVCGLGVALRWLWAVLTHLGACRKSGNLQPADAVLGEGPFAVRLGNAKAVLCGEQAMTGIREIWVRDPYLANYLVIPPTANVVDLGANMGVFTALALGHGPGVRVVAVEADPNECRRLRRMLEFDRSAERVTVVNAFVGGTELFQKDLRSAGRCDAVPIRTESEILSHVAGATVDFLKCDIEGSEFAMFANPGPLLAAAKQIAIELHPDCGDVDVALDQLKRMGFEMRSRRQGPTVLALGRRVIARPIAANPGP
jgi:FkbM family methyltransferase